MNPSRRLASQRGLTIFGMVALAVILFCVAVLLMRIYPVVTEYLTIRKVVNQIMHADPGSPTEVRTKFERATEIEYGIQSISSKDLDIKQVDDRMTTSFAYTAEVPVFEPVVYLTFKFSGSASNGGGAGPKTP
ncbi:MAG TPA: DUF4845 domain-containing protein [Burkholderiaceae bacterium]